ncbi:MAG TPA: serine/threonine-protein kinase [Polyangiaceae bacterium]|jgi:hypothetical protein
MDETLRDGRFVLVGTLGEGAQGRTFDAVDKREGRPVAVKRFDVRGATSWKDVELAEREARVLQSLSHARLPRYVDRFEEGGALYLVMEKIEGESLAVLRKRGATLGEKDVVRLLHDAAAVLDYLHGRAPPVIHRDLKPGNVIRRPDGSFAFVDFGAVRDKLRPEGGSTVVGTFGYMAPEQFQGRALPGSDVYALGATAVAMLTGREPEELPHRGLALDVRAALRGRASDALVGVLEQMLDPDPDRRASRIAPLLARLEGRGSRSRSEGATGRRPELSSREQRRARRHARRRERREQRQAQRQERAGRGVPWPLALIFTLVFGVLMLAVTLATQVVVPLVLWLLSIVFARRALRGASAAVRDAGKAAIDGMDRSRRWLHGEAGDGADGAGEDGGVRVAPPEPPPARVRVDDPGEDEEDEADESRRGGRKR